MIREHYRPGTEPKPFAGEPSFGEMIQSLHGVCRGVLSPVTSQAGETIGYHCARCGHVEQAPSAELLERARAYVNEHHPDAMDEDHAELVLETIEELKALDNVLGTSDGAAAPVTPAAGGAA